MVEAPMSSMEAILLGVVQGLTEFLPISSSAHLRIVPAAMHLQDPGVAYDAVIQLGSVLAVIAYFAKDLWRIGKGAFIGIKTKEYDAFDVRIAGAIIVGTIPICFFGFLLKPIIEQPDSPLRSTLVIGVSSIVMGLLLLLAEKVATHRRSLETIGAKDGLLVGLGQVMAVIPGCSRSGSTLTVAMLLDLNRKDAARFSFLLGIPAILISGLLELKHIMDVGLSGQAMNDLIIGFVVSAAVSYAAIAWLLKYLQQHSTWVFVAYRFLFGSIVIFLTLTQAIH